MTPSPAQALITGLHHVGVPVRDLDATLAWYRDKLGVEPTFVQRAEEGEGLDMHVQLEDARMRFAFVELGNTILEFQQYENPVPLPHDRRNCDVGASHVCFTVDDIQSVYETLVERGVTFAGPPTYLDGGNLDGCWFCYFRDPDGIQLELFQTA
jgi:catechol 2,3-dioxygenase-like lactoylglutathione lyase family enzyme